MASAGYMPFSGMLQQAGFPSSQSLLILIVALINLIGNILLVPTLGLVGAATATAIAQAAFAVLLILMVRRKLKFQL
jgi:Na+-driven multidrug efflux pump